MANPSLPGIIADFILTAIESPAAQAEITTLVTTGEGTLRDAVTQILKNAKPSGFLGLIYPALAGSIESYVATLLAAHTPAEIVAFITYEVQLEAKALGG